MATKQELLASIDAMEADLAALRAEVAAHWPDDVTPTPDPAPDPDPDPNPTPDPDPDPDPDPTDPPPGPTPVPTPTPTPSPTPSPAPTNFKSQVGPWFMERWNQEMAPLNYFKTGKAKWLLGGPTGAAIDPALIDVATGFPTALPSGSKISSAFFFDMPDAAEGDYIAEIIGDASISLGGVASNRVSPKRLEFSMPATKKSMSLTIDSIGSGGIQDIRIYFKVDAAALAAGKLWSPRFVNEVGKYDIIRTMDLQQTNGIFVTSAADIATVDYAYWGAKANSLGLKQSLPLEALFSLGVEADTEIWFQTPIALGFPWRWKDPAVPNSSSVDAMRDDAKANAAAILSSPEWDKYADDVVAALEAAGYPETRRLLISVSNEIWNYASFDFRRHTEYANGIGQSKFPTKQWAFREGYGILMANMMMAMQNAFAKAGRAQLVEYVFEGQAADDWNTTTTLREAKKHIESRGEVWADFAALSGYSVASYWGGKKTWEQQQPFTQWAADIAADPIAAAKKRSDWLINATGTKFGLNWVLNRFKAHAAKAAGFGVKMLGAYEGGSHDIRHDQIPAGFYNAYLWGPEGARVNHAVIDALIAAFPGIIITNYGTIGSVGGQPWHEGPYGATNEYALSWQKYQRPHS